MQKKRSTRFKLIDAAVILICVAGSVLSGATFWKEYTRTLSKLNEEPIGTVTFKKRTVQRKFLEHVIWDRLKQESPVYNGDTIRTIEVSEAVVTFRDITTRLMLNENTLIQVFYTDEYGARVDFSSGNMAVDSGSKSVLITSGSSQIIIDGRANLDKGDEGFSLSVMDGTVNYDGEYLNMGDIYTLDLSGIPVETPVIAVTSFPSSARVLASPDEKVPVTFSWNAVNFNPGTTVIVDVAADRKFSRIIERSQTAESSASVMLSGGAYWWRAFPSNNGGEPVNNMYPTGTLEVIASTPPELIAPAQQAEFFADENSAVAFSWTSSTGVAAGAAAYLLEISPNRDMSGAVVARNVQGTSVVIPGLDAGSYFWRVSPMLPDWIIGELPPSQTGSFAVRRSSSVPVQPSVALPESVAVTPPSVDVPEPVAITPPPVVVPELAVVAPPHAVTPEPVAIAPPPSQQTAAHQIRDDAVIWQENGHRYLVVDQSMTWDEANTYAASRGGHLAVIENANEQAFILNLIRSGNKNFYWLGGYRDGNRWRWINGANFSYRNWAPNQPDNHQNRQNKLMIIRVTTNLLVDGARAGQWDDVNTDGRVLGEIYFNADNKGLIIEWDAQTVSAVTPPHAVTPEPVAVAPPPSQQTAARHASDDAIIWQENGHGYLVVNQQMTWDEANTYARERGGYLATITSREEQRFVMDLLSRDGDKNNYWLGGYRESRNWHWVTGESFRYTNWLPTQPDNSHGIENKLQIVRILHSDAQQVRGRQGQWNDNSNDNFGWGSYGFIIEWDAQTASAAVPPPRAAAPEPVAVMPPPAAVTLPSINVISADSGWVGGVFGGNASVRSRTTTNLSFSRETIQNREVDVMTLSVNIASGNEWRMGNFFSDHPDIIQRLRAANGVRFKVSGDGGRGWYIAMSTPETDSDGGRFRTPITTRRGTVVDVDVPFSRLRQPAWARSVRFNRETIGFIEIARHANGDDSFSGESIIKIFDFEIY
jgi:hypothetical protein